MDFFVLFSSFSFHYVKGLNAIDRPPTILSFLFNCCINCSVRRCPSTEMPLANLCSFSNFHRPSRQPPPPPIPKKCSHFSASAPLPIISRPSASPRPLPFASLLVALTIFVSILCVHLPYATAVRNKEIDENYQRLIPLGEIPSGCEHAKGVIPGTGDPAKEYGFVGGALEKCQVWLEGDEQSSSDEEGHYERYKCKHLKVHGHFNEETGKCECKDHWKGTICNDYIGCPANHSYYLGVCTPNNCQHEGELALGSKHIECICKAPWDGRFCERLACWRMAEREHERRWSNAVDHCRCADNYEGKNCETVVSCQNGELVGGRCQCAEGWKGEVCDRKCTPNQTCSSPPTFAPKIGLFLSMFGVTLATIFFGNRRWALVS